MEQLQAALAQVTGTERPTLNFPPHAPQIPAGPIANTNATYPNIATALAAPNNNATSTTPVATNYSATTSFDQPQTPAITESPEKMIIRGLAAKIEGLGIPANIIPSLTKITDIFAPQVLMSITNPAQRAELGDKLRNLIEPELTQIIQNRTSSTAIATSDIALQSLIDLALNPLAAQSTEANLNPSPEQSFASMTSRAAQRGIREVLRSIDNEPMYGTRNLSITERVQASDAIIKKIDNALPQFVQHSPRAVASSAVASLINNFGSTKNPEITQLAFKAIGLALANNPAQAIEGISRGAKLSRYFDSPSVAAKLTNLTKLVEIIQATSKQVPQLAADCERCLRVINHSQEQLLHHNNVAGFNNTAQTIAQPLQAQAPVVTTPQYQVAA